MDIQVISGGQAINDAVSAVINSYNILCQPAYWRAINFLADNMASFDIDVFLNETKVQERHPLDRFFSRRANQTQTAHAYWHTLNYHAEHFGNGYGYIRRANFASTEIIGLYNLMPEDVTPFRVIPDDGNIFDASIWYWHTVTKQAIPADDIIHFHGLSFDGLIGYSVPQLMTSTFRKAGAIERYSLRTIERGTNIKGTIEFPAVASKETVVEVVDTLKKFRNATGDRDVLVLSGGAKLNNAGLSPADLQLDAQDATLTKKIAQITGVSPRFLFEHSESKYTDNAEAAGDDVVRFTFRTRIEARENELTVKLLSEADQDAGYSIRLDANALTRGDTKTETDIAATKVNQGLASLNQVRPDLGLPTDPDPASDQIRQPTHLVAPKEGGTSD